MDLRMRLDHMLRYVHHTHFLRAVSSVCSFLFADFQASTCPILSAIQNRYRSTTVKPDKIRLLQEEALQIAEIIRNPESTRIVKRSTRTLNPIKQQLYSYHAPSKSTISLGALRFYSDSPPKCWNCDYMYKSELFCSKCKVLQELPQNLNYFDIIGIKKNYNVMDEEIHRKYKELQKMLHPDKFGNKSEKERQISESFSSLINKAYSTLVHPLKRGLYMLQLKGISISEGTTNLNPEFLMEIMERNEEIDNAVDDRDKILKLAKESKELLDAMSMQVANAFDKKDIDTATKILIKMKYYYTVDNRLKKLRHDLGIVE